MYVQEAESLAILAALLRRGDDEAQLRGRAESQRRLIADHLWDDEAGIFANRFWNGSFYTRVSPTSFYPLLAGAATDAQAASLVQGWLLSPRHFCISPAGDFAV